MDPVKLDDEQMNSLVDLLAAKMLAAQANAEQEPAKEEEPKKKPPANEAPAGFTLEEITNAVTNSLKENTGEQNKKIFATMWADKLNAVTSSTPGLSEFLADEDDYGNVRGDQLNAVEDFDKRVSALDKLTNSFREASAGTAGRKPIVNKLAEKKAEESKSDYEELERKSAAGEFGSVAEMNKAWMDTMAKEADGLM